MKHALLIPTLAIASLLPSSLLAGDITPAVYYPSGDGVKIQKVVVTRRAATRRTRRVVRRRSKKKSVAIVAGSAAGGAAIGALAGGGKGAAIGALVGGGSGLVYDRATHKKTVTVPR